MFPLGQRCAISISIIITISNSTSKYTHVHLTLLKKPIKQLLSISNITKVEDILVGMWNLLLTPAPMPPSQSLPPSRKMRFKIFNNFKVKELRETKHNVTKFLDSSQARIRQEKISNFHSNSDVIIQMQYNEALQKLESEDRPHKSRRTPVTSAAQ